MVTNQNLYFETADHGGIVKSGCNAKSDQIQAFQEIVAKASSSPTSEHKQNATLDIDQTCAKIPGSSKLKALSNFTNSESSESKNLQVCIESLIKETQSQNIQKSLSNIKDNILGISKQGSTGTGKPIKLTCETRGTTIPKDKQASCDIDNSKIQLYNETFFTISPQEIQKEFVHEFVHLNTRPLEKSESSEILAELVSKKCALGQTVPKDDFERLQKTLDKRSTSVIDTQSKATVAEVGKTGSINIKHAVESTPPQKVSVSEVTSVSNIAENTTPSNSRLIGNSFGSVMSKPITTFSQMADRVASVVIPSASAATVSTTSSSSSEKAYRPSRYVASELNVGSAKPGEKMTEEIFLPDSENPEKLLKTTIVHNDSTPGQLLKDDSTSNHPDETAKAKSLRLGQNSQKGGASRGADGVSSSGHANLGMGGSIGGSKNTAEEKQKSSTPLASIQGVAFVPGTIAGSSYESYKEKIKNPDFKRALEENGIMITANGALVSKPKKVSLAYIDNGKSLVYADF